MRKCVICKAKFTAKHKSIERWCSPEHGYEYAKMLKEKKEKKEFREYKKKTKEKITNWKTELQKKVQQIARLIDTGLPCIARGPSSTGNIGQIHGGHVYPKGGYPQMRFNLHNIHRQGAHSNHFQNDDGKMRDGVEREYGTEYLNFLKSMTGTQPPKLSNKEYHEKYKLANLIVNKLKKATASGGTYAKFQRLSLRNQINYILNIYPESLCSYKINNGTQPTGRL